MSAMKDLATTLGIDYRPVRVTMSLRTSALLCRNDVVRAVADQGHARDPWTGDLVHLATGYPPVR